MSAPIPVPGAAPNDGADFDGTIPPVLVEELLRNIAKAVRARQLYPGNNPTWLKAVELVQASFAPIWAADSELPITVRETEFRYGPHVVMAEEGRSSDSLPWIFYKDGVRALTFTPGVEGDEIVRLIEILPRVRRASPDEDDLLTLLWEGGFNGLRYRYVDVGSDGPEVFEDQMGEPTRWSDDPEGRRARVAAALGGDGEEGDGTGHGGGGGEGDGEGAGEERKSSVVNLADFDSTLYFLDERELGYLRNEITKEYQRDHRSNVLAMLLDTFEFQTIPEIRDEICELLEYFVLSLLAAGEIRPVAALLRESAIAAQRATDLLPVHRDRLASLPERLSDPETLAQVLQGLDASPHLPSQDELNELFDQLRVHALGTVLSWLGRLAQPQLRSLLEVAADRIARQNTIELVKLLSSTDRAVQLEAIRRSGALKTAAAVAPIGKALTEGDVEVRQSCVQALSEIGSPGALQLLERGLADTDRDVRVGVARALMAARYRAALNRLEAIVKGKEIHDRDKTEMMAMFEAYGAVCGDGGIPLLDTLLNGKGFLGRREQPEMRACAAMALSRIGTPKALEALRKSVDEKDVVVRNAVNRALRGEAPR